MKIWQTYEHFRSEPSEKEDWKQACPGEKWGDNWLNAWFKGDIKLPDICEGSKVFICAKTGGETLFIADGSFKGVFDENHPVVMLTMNGDCRHTYHITLEAYAGHFIPGTAPDEYDAPPAPGCKLYEGVEIMLEREDVSAFVFDLKVLLQTALTLDVNSLRRNIILKGLSRVYTSIEAMPSEVPEEKWRPRLAGAIEIMRPLLDTKNGTTTPKFGIIGHSHIDTAWLWPIAETWRKCARTFSSVLNLMEQYPEFKFIQSVPYHNEVVKELYPEIFVRIKEKVRDDKWEVNGAMWVEPDCNIPSGESFVRQLLMGQSSNRELFSKTADTLWLPDVFGYSGALPQLLRGCGVEFFCTTKLRWNDTNRFPYDTFKWKGIDGTEVIAHFNYIHNEPDPKTLSEQWNDVAHKDVQDRVLCAFGYGDGGGGPMAEMLEVSRRTGDLEGCPRTDYTTVSDFMKGIKSELTDLPEWAGEIYLELHRGTYTSVARVKRGNRKTEVMLRNAEFICTLAALKGAKYPRNELKNIWKTLLTNQFHDILPGSSIARVNDEAVVAFAGCMEAASEISRKAIDILGGKGEQDTSCILAANSLSWDLKGEVVLDNAPEGYSASIAGSSSQGFVNIEGKYLLAVTGVTVPALGTRIIPLAPQEPEKTSPFIYEDRRVETPYHIVAFDELGRIGSLIDKASGRELVKKGAALNTFLLGEDVPEEWDNWDIDRDQSLKMQIERGFLGREKVSDGPIQLRLRSRYKIGENSFMTQDMVFHSSSPKVDFETVLEWAEKHKLLKAAFDLDVFAGYSRNEIQFGHAERSTNGNLSEDRAKFEVCCHKWVDISEAEFGVSLLNDCKYGVSVRNGEIGLSLMKSGLRPDMRGDEGRHLFTYSLLTHACEFSVEAVVRPAYELNVPMVSMPVSKEAQEIGSLFEIDAPNIIVESVKWAECGEGFIVRLYDALRTGKTVNVKFNIPVKSICETNLLEEKANELKLKDNTASFYVKPFEVKTLWCRMG